MTAGAGPGSQLAMCSFLESTLEASNKAPERFCRPLQPLKRLEAPVNIEAQTS